MNTASRWLRPYLSLVPAWIALVIAGAIGLAMGFWNLVIELGRFGATVPPLLAGLLAITPSVGVIYAGLWLRGREMTDREKRFVAGSGLGGWLFLVLTQTLTVLIRIAEGRPIEGPLFPVVVVGSVGALGGTVIGHQYVRARRAAAKAAEARDAVAFANSLLRHDVRNSLQVIDGRVDVLRRSDADEVADHADAIRGQTDSLDSLITEVQAVVEAVSGEGVEGTVDVGALLRDAVDSTQQSHPDALIETDLAADLTAVGSGALRSVFDNLLSNAVEHAGDDATVRVRATEVDGSVSIRVTDDGPGVPEVERQRIFEPGVSDGAGGYGLYVAQTIVERFGGTLTVEDSDLGGAAFVVTLPAGNE